ncbi:MAG: hypothetical protein A2Z04_07355 [Chloroflexi bacterium RBG_16_57_9]|nr:MAG: hypothetical protein A2Z04_07355 [Chloroflexi bacterium RBG_16_57_9]
MSAVPSLGFYISVGLAVIVGSLALMAGATPLNALVKAVAALLAFGTVSWALSMALIAAHLKGEPTPPQMELELEPEPETEEQSDEDS